jgi:hypothetical protein
MAVVLNPLVDDDEEEEVDVDDDDEAEGSRVEILAKVGKRDRVVVELTVEVVVRSVRASMVCRQLRDSFRNVRRPRMIVTGLCSNR